MGRVGDLEIDQDLAFSEREWTAQRVGCAALALLVVAALLGLFGNGPISWTTATASGLEVDYERFGRRGGSQELTVRAGADAAENGEWQVEVSRDYLAALEITATTPQPSRVEVIDGALRYTFTRAAPTADLEVIFAVTPRHLWSQDGEIRLRTGERVTVTQFFFP